MTTRILKTLMNLQKEKGLTNGQFAEALDIHKQSWIRIKRTGIIGSDTLFHAVAVYPELREKFMNHAVHTASDKPSQNKNLRALALILINAIKDFFKKLFLHWGKTPKSKSGR